MRFCDHLPNGGYGPVADTFSDLSEQLKKKAPTVLGGGGVSGVPGADRRLEHQVSGPVRVDAATPRQQLAGVFKNHDPIAEQAPALIGVAGQRSSRLAVRSGC